jgi:hypothetical protein
MYTLFSLGTEGHKRGRLVLIAASEWSLLLLNPALSRSFLAVAARSARKLELGPKQGQYDFSRIRTEILAEHVISAT